MLRAIRTISTMIGATVILGACASENLNTQALEPGASDLSAVEHQLVLLPTRIRPSHANLKLRGIIVSDKTNGQRKSFSFFNNFILGSRLIPHTVENGAVSQNILLDLPEGEYAVESVSFFFLDDTEGPAALRHELDPSLTLTVNADPFSYAGRLDMDFRKLYLTGIWGTREYTFPLTENVVTRPTVENARADIDFSVSANPETDLAQAIAEYPALSNATFDTSLLR